jgi:hypothetical protein
MEVVWRLAFGVRRSAFVLVLVLERCCLQRRRVNPIRSAFPRPHGQPPGGCQRGDGRPVRHSVGVWDGGGSLLCVFA